MSLAWGVRVTDIGPNRLEVLARIRPLLSVSPAGVMSLAERGPIVVGEEFSRMQADVIADELRQLGATVETFITTLGSDHWHVDEERLFFEMIERGLADSDQGRAISNEEMRRRMESWRRS